MQPELCLEREAARDPVADDILLQALQRDGTSLQKAVRHVSHLHPEWRLQVIWNRVRYLKRKSNGNHNGSHGWTGELEETLRLGYQRGPLGARKAIRQILEARPGWSRTAVWARAHRLGITIKRKPRPRTWTEQEERYVVMHATVTPIRVIAKRLKRSEAAVRAKIRDLGYSSRYEGGYTASRIAELLHVSRHTIRRWMQKGWLGKNWGGRISEASFRAFLENHVDRIHFDALTPEARNQLAEELGFEPDGKPPSEEQDKEPHARSGSRSAAGQGSSQDG